MKFDVSLSLKEVLTLAGVKLELEDVYLSIPDFDSEFDYVVEVDDCGANIVALGLGLNEDTGKITSTFIQFGDYISENKRTLDLEIDKQTPVDSLAADLYKLATMINYQQIRRHKRNNSPVETSDVMNMDVLNSINASQLESKSVRFQLTDDELIQLVYNRLEQVDYRVLRLSFNLFKDTDEIEIHIGNSHVGNICVSDQKIELGSRNGNYHTVSDEIHKYPNMDAVIEWIMPKLDEFSKSIQ